MIGRSLSLAIPLVLLAATAEAQRFPAVEADHYALHGRGGGRPPPPSECQRLAHAEAVTASIADVALIYQVAMRRRRASRRWPTR
jgi:hypothetical protein